MDTLDNANNPFAIPNKTNADCVTPENEDMLLNITDGLKKNDNSIPNNDLMKMLEKSNCDRITPEFDDEDNLGPETDVDNPEDGSLSPNLDVMKRQSETLNNNQNSNPFNNIEKSLAMNWNLKEGAFDGPVTPSEETCPLPTANNGSQLIDAGAESDSEEDEEWNYVRGEEANKENVKPLQLNSKVAEEDEEEEDNMSQLNPNAAEFVPVSPVRVAPSPIGRVLDDDLVLSQSPKKPPPTEELDLNVPSPVDFENEIIRKPHELEETISNGHQMDLTETGTVNSHKSEEFHFGPNAAPFTPIKLLDQSEASSTKAVYGDDTEVNLGTSFNDSAFDLDQADFVRKEDDPMSMSFHQDRADDTNRFDLNKVHVLPEDVDDFINEANDSNPLLNETISDLAEHFPSGKPDNIPEFEKEPVTDLDKEHTEDSIQETERLTPDKEKIEIHIAGVEDQRPICPLVHEENDHNKDEITKSPLGIETPSSQFEEDRTFSPVDGDNSESQVDVHTSESPFEDKELYCPVEEKELCSPVQNEEIGQITEREICSPVENIEHTNLLETVSSPVESKQSILDLQEEVCSLEENIQEILSVQEKAVNLPEEIKEEIITIPEPDTQENKLGYPSELQCQIRDQSKSPVDIVENNSHIQEIKLLEQGSVESMKVSTSCDNLSSPLNSEVSSPNNDEFMTFETEKSDLEKAKETVDNILQLDTVNEVLSSEPYAAPDTTNNETPGKEEAPVTTDLLGSLETAQHLITENLPDVKENEKDDTSPSQIEENVVSSSTWEERPVVPELTLEVEDAQTMEFHSQPTPEIDQPLIDNADLLNMSAKSVADTESVGTTEVNSFLERSLLAGMESPLSPNQSNACVESTENATATVDVTPIPCKESLQEPALDSSFSSPIREILDLPNVTSTPSADKPVSVILQPSPKSPVEVSAPKVKETDKKETKTKVSSSGPTKKTPTTRHSLAPSKTSATPSPRAASSRMSTPLLSKTNSNVKTESTTSTKAAAKPLSSVASKTTSSTTARVPLSSRTTKPTTATKTNATNGTTKPTAKPPTTTSTGTVKRTLPGTTAKSTASTTSSRPASSTTRAPLASARSAPAVATTKTKSNVPSASTTKTSTSTTSKTSVTKSAASTTKTSSTVPPKTTSSSATKTPLPKLNSKPRPATEKQIKETANKLTASKTTTKTNSATQVASKSSLTKKAEERVSSSRTTTNRTNTTTAASKPIKKPTDSSRTTTTKVGKPKLNGIAPVVTEQIIMNNASNQLNGISSNGDQQFVKDNSPVDNKLIIDNSAETAAN